MKISTRRGDFSMGNSFLEGAISYVLWVYVFKITIALDLYGYILWSY